LAKVIVRKGWVLSRVKGSHHVYVMAGRRERIVIPIHGSQPLKIGLLRNLMKIADITEDEL
jgi:predicted RNA binding protein YcfA (HicA-like mRNA interferase family)